ncbi:MAG: hypothetical protein E6G94_15670 [Alphaproteobacteria bacterium]|nr:MAG: hypothetical protein E6G94_15670 [Alphaproteobacteria bacterium]
MTVRRALLPLLLLAPSALAAQTPQSGQGRLEIVGDAPGACVVIGPATAGPATNASYAAEGPSSGQLRITQMVTAPDSVSRGATAEFALTVICNSPHQLVLRSEKGGMRLDGGGAKAASGPFASVLPYEMRASWLGEEGSAASDAGGPLVMRSNRSGAGQLSLAVVVPQGVRLLAGDYRDSVILEFRAAD